MTPENNKRIAREFLDAVGMADVARVSAMMTEDATWWVIPSTPFSGMHDKQSFLGLFPQVIGLGEGPLTYRYDDITAEEDRVCITAKGHMKLKSGKIYAGDYHFLLFFRDGKIAGGKEYADTAHAADIFGFAAVAETA